MLVGKIGRIGVIFILICSIGHSLAMKYACEMVVVFDYFFVVYIYYDLWISIIDF